MTSTKVRILLAGVIAVSLNAYVHAGDKQLHPTAAPDVTDEADYKSTDPQAETAREAYEESDAGPVENWFGCPPIDKVVKDTAEDTAVADTVALASEDDCDPEAPQNTNSPNSQAESG